MPTTAPSTEPTRDDPSERSEAFQKLNRAYNSVFKPDRLSVGLVVPLESYGHGPVPSMEGHLQRVQLAETLGFAAVWLRDVPFNVPSFGDAGQLFDPFAYLGYLAASTQGIGLGVASIVLPLRHPAHVAKAAASVDQLSNGRLLLGVASGDRPEEYPALNLPFKNRGERFRQSFEYIRRLSESAPQFENAFGALGGGIDLLPKPTSGKLPLLITGGSQQSPEWLARHGDGWMTYPRPLAVQTKLIQDWRTRTQQSGRPFQPVMQPLYIDLASDPDAAPQPIHLGLRLGLNRLNDHLKSLEEIGINHIALNLRFNQRPVEATLEKLANHTLPHFNHRDSNP